MIAAPVLKTSPFFPVMLPIPNVAGTLGVPSA